MLFTAGQPMLPNTVPTLPVLGLLRLKDAALVGLWLAGHLG